jgi:DNA repair protein RadC
MAREDETGPLSAEDQQGFAFGTAPEQERKPSPNAGHRERLRERLLVAGPHSLSDHELIEFLLFAAIPRRDTKPLAKDLLAHHGSFENLISASPDALRTLLKTNEVAIGLLKAVEAAAIRLAARKIEQRDLISSNAALLDYCRTSLANQSVEQFRVLFLNTKNRLIKDVLMGQGTVDHAPVYVREIVAKGLQLGAKSMILLHNHPGGDPTPSSADITMTKEIVAAAKPLGIAVHDHLVIGRNGHTSFRSAGLF